MFKSKSIRICFLSKFVFIYSLIKICIHLFFIKIRIYVFYKKTSVFLSTCAFISLYKTYLNSFLLFIKSERKIFHSVAVVAIVVFFVAVFTSY